MNEKARDDSTVCSITGLDACAFFVARFVWWTLVAAARLGAAYLFDGVCSTM
jgi:hypothetical protein